MIYHLLGNQKAIRSGMRQEVCLASPRVLIFIVIATWNKSHLFRFKSAFPALFTLGKYNFRVTICEERLLNNKGLRDKQQSLVAMHWVQNLNAENLKDLFKGFWIVLGCWLCSWNRKKYKNTQKMLCCKVTKSSRSLTYFKTSMAIFKMMVYVLLTWFPPSLNNVNITYYILYGTICSIHNPWKETVSHLTFILKANNFCLANI